MRLYKSSNGQWVGTQREAQKNFPRDWKETEVPTSKAELIAFLNSYKVGGKPAAENGCAAANLSKPDSLEAISPEAYSWVNWAYETLRRGDKKEAEAMLLNGLNGQVKK
tara:strand:+ start:697 stop:1023 length:327 start_codon:yes stop_codon:yes gene_type:complete